MKHETKQSYKQAILGFLLTFVFIVALCILQFLSHYSDDFFGKNLDTLVVFKIIFLEILSVSEYALPISVLVMTIIHYRKLSKQGLSEIRIKSTFLTSVIFALVCFIWIAFVLPTVNLHCYGLLYDIRSKEINKPIERTNLSLFKNSTSTSDYFQLEDIIDSTYSHTSKQKAAFLKNVKESQISGVQLNAYQDSINNEIENNNYQINKLRIKKANMLAFPIMVFILFYSGMFLGILNKNNRLFFLLASTYLTVLPGIYFLSVYFEKLAKNKTLTAFQGQLCFISILLLITLGLYFYTKQHIKREKLLLVIAKDNV